MNNLSRSAMLISLMMVLSKFLGFLREVCLANRFGASYIVDAYLVAIALPEVLYPILVGGFSESFVVGSARLRTADQREKYFNNTVTILFFWAGILSIMSFLGSHWISRLLAPGFDSATAQTLSTFLQIISISLPFMAVFNILCANLQTKECFTVPYFCDFIVTNVLILIFIQVSTPEAPNWLVIGRICAYVVTTALLWVYSFRKKMISYRPCVDLQDRDFRNLCKLAVPLGASLIVSQFNNMIDRAFSSSLGEGVTSALGYANKVQLLFYTLTTSIFISVCYPRINKHFAEMDKEGGMYYIRQAVLVALYISLPVMGGLVLFANPIISLLFERGMFTADATAVTAECLTFYALGIPFYALREIGTQALGASLQQRRIFKNTILSVVFNLLLNAFLVHPLGHIGLALATSLSGLFTFLLILLDMRKLELRFFTDEQLQDFGKIVCCSIISLLICGACYRFLWQLLGSGSAILLGIGAAGVTYLALSLFFHINIVIWIYQRLPAKVQIIPWLNRRQIKEDK